MSLASLRSGIQPTWKRLLASGGIDWHLQILIFLVTVMAVVSRRPDALFNPQFFGEDGPIWYRDAYVSGWFSALFHPQNGYFQTLPRLAAALAQLVPLRFAPLVMNLVGITFQVLPVNILLSSRCANWGPLYVRGLMAVTYIALPNTRELDASVEEGQWHLALLACLVVLASRPNTRGWRIFDISIVVLSGFSGPFGLMLLPISLVRGYLRRERWFLTLSAALTLPVCVQVAALIKNASSTRSHAILGATPQLFVRILAGQVYLGAIVGENKLPAHRNGILLAFVALLGTVFLVYTFLHARLEWKLFLVFCMGIFAASLISPMVSDTTPQWQILMESIGIRYWFLPMLAFVWALLWCVASESNFLVRNLAAASLLLMCVGITENWRYPAYHDFGFPKYARDSPQRPPEHL